MSDIFDYELDDQPSNSLFGDSRPTQIRYTGGYDWASNRAVGNPGQFAGTDAALSYRRNGEEEGGLLSLEDTLLFLPRGLEGAVQGVYGLLDIASFDALPDYTDEDRVFGQSKTMIGGFAEGLTQFLIPFSALGMAGRLGKLGKVGKWMAKDTMASEAVRGGIVDFAAFQGSDGRLSDLVKGTPFENAVSEYLATDMDDTELEGRLKNLAEGGILGSLVDPLFRSSKMIREYKKYKAGGLSDFEAASGAVGIFDEQFDNYIDQQSLRVAEDRKKALGRKVDDAMEPLAYEAGRDPEMDALRGEVGAGDVEPDVWRGTVNELLQDTKIADGLRGQARDAVMEFVGMVGARNFDDVSVSVGGTAPERGVTASYSYLRKTVSIFSESFRQGSVRENTMHELWHALEQRLSTKQRRKVVSEFLSERQAYLSKSEEATERFERLREASNDGEVANAVRDIIAHDEYQYISPAEWWATNGTLATQQRQAKLSLVKDKGVRGLLAQTNLIWSDFTASLRKAFGVETADSMMQQFLAGRVRAGTNSVLSLRGLSKLGVETVYNRTLDSLTDAEVSKINGAMKEGIDNGLTGIELASSIPYPKLLNGFDTTANAIETAPKFGKATDAPPIVFGTEYGKEVPGTNIVRALLVLANDHASSKIKNLADDYLKTIGIVPTPEAKRLLVSIIDGSKRKLEDMISSKKASGAKSTADTGLIETEKGAVDVAAEKAEAAEAAGAAKKQAKISEAIRKEINEGDRQVKQLGLSVKEAIQWMAVSRYQLTDGNIDVVDNFLKKRVGEGDITEAEAKEIFAAATEGVSAKADANKKSGEARAEKDMTELSKRTMSIPITVGEIKQILTLVATAEPQSSLKGGNREFSVTVQSTTLTSLRKARDAAQKNAEAVLKDKGPDSPEYKAAVQKARRKQLEYSRTLDRATLEGVEEAPEKPKGKGKKAVAAEEPQPTTNLTPAPADENTQARIKAEQDRIDAEAKAQIDALDDKRRVAMEESSQLTASINEAPKNLRADIRKKALELKTLAREYEEQVATIRTQAEIVKQSVTAESLPPAAAPTEAPVEAQAEVPAEAAEPVFDVVELNTGPVTTSLFPSTAAPLVPEGTSPKAPKERAASVKRRRKVEREVAAAVEDKADGVVSESPIAAKVEEIVEAKPELAEKLASPDEGVRAEAVDEIADAVEEAPAAAPTAPAGDPASFTLPRDLAGAKPRYGNDVLEFASDYDKVAYILAKDAEGKASKSAPKYRAALEAAGLSVEEAIAHGKVVKQALKEQGVTAVETPVARAAAAEVAPAPVPAAAVPEPTPAAVPAVDVAALKSRRAELQKALKKAEKKQAAAKDMEQEAKAVEEVSSIIKQLKEVDSQLSGATAPAAPAPAAPAAAAPAPAAPAPAAPTPAAAVPTPPVTPPTTPTPPSAAPAPERIRRKPEDIGAEIEAGKIPSAQDAEDLIWWTENNPATLGPKGVNPRNLAPEELVDAWLMEKAATLNFKNLLIEGDDASFLRVVERYVVGRRLERRKLNGGSTDLGKLSMKELETMGLKFLAEESGLNAWDIATQLRTDAKTLREITHRLYRARVVMVASNAEIVRDIGVLQPKMTDNTISDEELIVTMMKILGHGEIVGAVRGVSSEAGRLLRSLRAEIKSSVGDLKISYDTPTAAPTVTPAAPLGTPAVTPTGAPAASAGTSTAASATTAPATPPTGTPPAATPAPAPVSPRVRVKEFDEGTLRQLAALRRIYGEEGIKDILKKLGGRDKIIITFNKYLSLLENQVKKGESIGPIVSNIANAMRRVGFFDFHNELWINALVSSSTTWVGVQGIANSLTATMRPIEQILGGAARAARGYEDGARAMSVGFRTYQGMIRGFMDSTTMLKRAFVEKKPIGTGSTYEAAPQNVLSSRNLPMIRKLATRGGKRTEAEADKFVARADFMLSAFSLPQRLIMTGDEFFKQMNYRGQLYARLYENFEKQGIVGSARETRIKEAMDKAILDGEFLTNERLLKDGQTEAVRNLGPTASMKQINEYAESYKDRLWAEMGATAGTMESSYDIKAMMDASLYGAKEATMQADPRFAWQKSLNQFVSRHPSSRLFLPFVSTPVNALIYAGDRAAPVHLMQWANQRFGSKLADRMEKIGAPNFLVDSLRENESRFIKELNSADPIVRSEAVGRSIVGTAFVGAGMALAASGMITGYGPKNKDERATWIQAGFQPYSIRVGDNWYSFGRLDPFTTLLGTMADLSLASKYANMDEQNFSTIEAGMASLYMSLVNNLTNKGYLQGVKTMVELLSTQDSSAFQKWAVRQAGSLVPFSSMTRTLTDYTDDYKRVNDQSFDDALVSAIYSQIPGLSNENLPARDLMGRPMTRTERAGPDLFSPINMVPVLDDELRSELISLGRAFRGAHYNRDGLDLRRIELEDGRNAFDFLQESTGKITLRGMTMEESVRALIRSDRYKSMSPYSSEYMDSPRVLAIRGEMAKYSARAWVEMQRKYPKLRNAVMQIKQARGLAAVGQAPEKLAIYE
jgi:hypothetical protein